MAVLRFPLSDSRRMLPNWIRSRSTSFSKRSLKASLPESTGSMPKWRSWVATMDQYLRAHPQHAADVVDELHHLLNQLQQRKRTPVDEKT